MIEFPLAPESLVTELKGNNTTIDTIGLGEVNVIKNIGLRELKFKLFIPRYINSLNDGFLNLQQNYTPINYLNTFREIMEKKCVVTLIIERILPDGTRIFNGNLKVTLESYSVEENAGEEGDFWVDVKVKEHRSINVTYYEATGNSNSDGQTIAVEVNERESKPKNKKYVVKSDDSLWKIAKLELNDGSLYKQIAKINNIADPDKISVGMTILLP